MNEQVIEKPRRRILFWIVVSFAALILLAGITAVSIQLINEYTLEMYLCGDNEITLGYGERYNDPGINIVFRGSILQKEGVIPHDTEFFCENPVDNEKIGTYQIVYTAKFRKWSAMKTRTVHIVDTVAPVITLNSVEGRYTVPGEAYVEEGFTATDEYDGDLTDQVVVVEADGIVTYTVKDSSGNQTSVQREIFYYDPVPPELKLLGPDTVYLNFGEPYQEYGCVAIDNLDGDVTDTVSITGTVNSYYIGSYTITYTVKDAFDNTSSCIRTVIVSGSNKTKPQTVVPQGKVIYLTFDDGPGTYTDRLLAILEKYDVKATFFVIDNGRYADLKKIANAGHSIGIHTASHDYASIYTSEEAFFKEVFAMQRLIYNKTGVYTTLVRFPGGSSNTVSKFNPGIMTRLTDVIEKVDFQYFDWNVDSKDAGGAKTAQQVFENVVNGCASRRVSVVLQHDIKGFSVEAVEKIIIWGLENGYRFLPLDPTSPGAHHGVNN